MWVKARMTNLEIAYGEVYKIINMLEEEYYNNGSMVEIEVDKFEELLNNKENFGVFIYQDFCAASANFEEVLGEYITEYNMSFYKLSFTNMNETKLKGKVKFYPSFIIFKDGKMVDYLDADSMPNRTENFTCEYCNKPFIVEASVITYKSKEAPQEEDFSTEYVPLI